MGLADNLRGQTVCIDTAPIIYFIEKHPKYINLLRPVFIEINSGNIIAMTSTVSLLEVMVLPFRTANTALAEKYREILLYSEDFTTLEITNDVSELAAKLRAKYDIRAPDAIQIATGIQHGASIFLTNDYRFKKVKEIKAMILDDFIEKR